MKWFKHYTNASEDSKLIQLKDKFGKEGYANYFLFVELCASLYNQTDKHKLVIHQSIIRKKLDINYRKIESFFSLAQELTLFRYSKEDVFYSIDFPNLSKIRDNHTKNLQVTGKKVSEKFPLDKEAQQVTPPKNKNKEGELLVNSTQNFENSFKFDYQKLYNSYPRREKKGMSISRLVQIINGDEKIYSDIEKGISNYTEHCVKENITYKFILTMPSWLDERLDWLDEENGKTTIETNKKCWIDDFDFEKGE